MADYWGASVLLLCVCTIGFFGFFTASMPTEFLTPLENPNLKFQTVAKDWVLKGNRDVYHLNNTITSSSIFAVKQIFDFNTATPSTPVVFAFQFYDDTVYGRILRLEWQTWGGLSLGGIYLADPKYEPMIFDDVSGYSVIGGAMDYRLYKSDLVNHWVDASNVSYFEKVTSRNPACHVQFADTNTTRKNIGSAWDQGEMQACISFGMDNVTITRNGLTMITELIFFQAWSWCDPLIMFVFDLPFWFMTVYCGVRVIRLFIPFLSGN